MAFSGDWKSDRLIKCGMDGWVGLHQSTPQYRAWERWLRMEFGKCFFPEWITVQGEWPPTTEEGARAYALALSNLRDSRYLKEQSAIGGRGVPQNPSPWDGRVPAEAIAA